MGRKRGGEGTQTLCDFVNLFVGFALVLRNSFFEATTLSNVRFHAMALIFTSVHQCVPTNNSK